MPHRFTLGVLVAFALAGGVAYAASTSALIGANGNLSACAPKHGGTLSVVRPGHRCSHGKVALSLATSATVGPAGPTGPSGATGPSNASATTVDGETLTKVFFKVPTPASSMATVTLFSGSGLTILGQCDNGGNAMVVANGPSSNDSDLEVGNFNNSGAPVSGSQTRNLGPSSAVAIGSPSAGQGTFTYASASGAVVTGSIGYEKAPALGSFNGCVFEGTVTSG